MSTTAEEAAPLVSAADAHGTEILLIAHRDQAMATVTTGGQLRVGDEVLVRAAIECRGLPVPGEIHLSDATR